MKNIFKLMGIALMAGALMVACNPDDPDPIDTNPNPGPGPQPQPQENVISITWGGEAQNPGVVDAYMYSSANTVYMLNAAKGLQNDSYEFPIFRFGFDLDENPQYGCALTAQYLYGQQQQVDGNQLWPTDVVETSYFQSQSSQNMGIIGDWMLDKYTGANESYQMEGAEFDATARKLSCNITVQMFSYTDLYDYIQAIEEPTNDDYMAGISAAEKKNLGISLTNYVFDAASQK